jgi:hypothetical protein
MARETFQGEPPGVERVWRRRFDPDTWQFLNRLLLFRSATMSSAEPASLGGDGNRSQMPLTIFDCKGISATERTRTEGAVAAAGRNLVEPYEAWIAADPLRGGVRVLITGPQGFDRIVTFDLAEDPAVIAQRIWERLKTDGPGAVL